MAYVDYKTLNPFSEILPGLIAGQQRKANQPEETRPPDAALADPGEAKQLKMEDFTQDVKGDIVTYNKLVSEAKRAGGSPEVQKFLINRWADPKRGYFKTELIQELAADPDPLKPEDLTKKFRNIITQGEGWDRDLDVIKSKSGGETGTGAKFIEKKQAQMAEAQKAANAERGEVLTNAIKSIWSVKDNPQQWQNKGVMNPQTEAIMAKEYDYIKELRMIAPEKMAELIEEKKRRAGGGTSGFKSQILSKDGTKKYSGSWNNEREALAEHPDADPNTLALAGRTGEFSQEDQKMKDLAEKRKKLLLTLPKPDKAGRVLHTDNKNDAKIIGQYIQAAGGDVEEGKRMAKQNKWELDE